MRLNEIEQRYDIVVASKIGRFVDYKDLSAEAAKIKLNNLVGDYQSDMFQNPRAEVEWTPNGEGAKLSDPDLGVIIFIYMSPTGMDNMTRRERALTIDESIGLSEISKAEFVDKMKDPAMAELKKMNRTIKKEIGVYGLMYSVKTYEHPDLGTRRKAEIMWDFRYIPQEAIQYMGGIEQKIAAHYKHELENWTLKGWDSMSNTTTYELVEA